MIGQLPRSRGRQREEAGILPLINVVFLLLIFVMLTGRMAGEHARGVEPPATAMGDASVTDALELMVREDGSLLLEGAAIERDGLALALNTRSKGSTKPRVRILADASADSRLVANLAANLRAAGADTVELIAVPRP
ncbi:biopolymer transporter ExbD [Ectothiorhodospiraceae bacterium WFHF3C12]|nr:biopolymer transporter ExbD [Ectothiorhodospiraceae bacterium WFHF3C12]